MARLLILVLFVGAYVLTSGFCLADQHLVSQMVSAVPNIDGAGTDDLWSQVSGIITTDIVANIPVELKSVYSGDNIYFLARYPDPNCSESHRSWSWNADLQEYERGSDREDVFVMKWFMKGDETDLILTSSTPYTADMWFWKACLQNTNCCPQSGPHCSPI